MDPIKQNDQQFETRNYESPKVIDYGTLQELTESGGTVNPADVPHGHPGTAFPVS
jgi:hypothetical protein